jgi:hypothetical protein
MAFIHSFQPNRPSRRDPSSSSGQLWIRNPRRLAASGFIYQYFFLTKIYRNTKAASITIVIDAVLHAFSPVNCQHTLSTIGSILAAFAVIPDSDEVVVDVITGCATGSGLLLCTLPVRYLSNDVFISDLIATVRADGVGDSEIGMGLNVALQIASGGNGVGFGKRITVFMDPIVTSGPEMSLFWSSLLDCESSGIDMVGLGIGVAPIHLPVLGWSHCHMGNNQGLFSAIGDAGIFSMEWRPGISKKIQNRTPITTTPSRDFKSQLSARILKRRPALTFRRLTLSAVRYCTPKDLNTN